MSNPVALGIRIGAAWLAAAVMIVLMHRPTPRRIHDESDEDAP